MTRVDHLLVSVTDLESARRRWTEAGLTAKVGGQHPGGTSNALVRGPRAAYLELITADADGTSAAAKRVLASPGPVSWALGVPDIEAVRAAAVEAGAEPGPVSDGSRETPTGEVLRWRVCDLAGVALHPFIPFLIEWGTEMRAGPADGPVLVDATVACPDPGQLGRLLEACGLTPTSAPHSFSDGEVTVTVQQGDPGLRSASFAVADGCEDEVLLDGLLVHRLAHAKDE